MQGVGAGTQGVIGDIGVLLGGLHPVFVEAFQLIDKARAVVDLAAGAGQLDGELFIVAQRDVTAVVKGFVENDTTLNLLTYGDVLVEDLQTAEDGHLTDTALTHVLGVDDVEAALAAHEDEPVGGIAHGPLVVGTVLQAVAVVVAVYHETPRTVVLLRRNDVRDAVVGSQPDGMLGIFDDAIDGRAEESRLHVEQIDVVALTVPDGGTLRGTLPDEFAAVLKGRNAADGNGNVVLIVRDVEVQDLEGLGVDVRYVFRVGDLQPALLGLADHIDVVAGQTGIADAEGAHLASMLVDALHAGSQRTYPDVAPHVFTQRPDVIGLKTGGIV